jgi:hypothetical protein
MRRRHPLPTEVDDRTRREPLGLRAPTHPVAPLQDENVQSGAAKASRRRQPRVPGTDDHDLSAPHDSPFCATRVVKQVY